jgi:tetratricopeptide (TPR) repeat protein
MKHHWLIRIAGLVGVVAAGVVFARWEPDPSPGPGGDREQYAPSDGPRLDPLTRDENRVTWLVRRERWDEAITLATDVLRRDPERTATLWHLADAHARRDQPGDAEASLAAYTRLNQLATKRSVEYRFPEQFRRLGLIRLRIGDDAGAREAYAQGAYLQRWYINGRNPDDVSERWWYNLACMEALAGNATAAFEALDRAIERGFTNVDHALSDPDLESLRDDPRFERALDAMRARTPDVEPSVEAPGD